MFLIKTKLKIFLFIFIISAVCRAQFIDNFDGKKINGWFWFTGDGYATMDFQQMDGFARLYIDASKDKDNVYWTLIKRDVTSSLDLSKLKDTTYQLRVEAKVRVHNAPRRVNFMINTNRTTDYHIDLMEYDIPDTTDWHVISMTTKRFDAHPGDTVYVQLCVTDFGIGKYYVDIDYYRADIVNVNTAGPDKGDLAPYHPPIPDVNTFSNHLGVDQDCIINSDFPDVNFNDWHVKEKDGDARILTVNINQWAVLRWDLNKFKNLKADGPAIMEITSQSIPAGGGYIKTFGEDFGIEFGKVKVIEIFGGDSAWDQNTVTYNSLIKGKAYSNVFNEQSTYDVDLSFEPGGKNFITLSQPVFQRMLDGKTKGLLIRQLGAMDASFYASENKGGNGPKLHFNVKR